MQTQYDVLAKQSGFTLVELMIVVAIAGVLTAVAYPSYRAQVNKGYVADAQSELSNTAFDMEQAYQENRTYQDPDIADTCAVANFSTDNFSFSCATNSKTTYLWTISNLSGGMGSADNYKYTINQSGTKKTIAHAGITLNTAGWEL